MNLGTRMTAAGAFAHLATLDDIVDEFKRTYEERFGDGHHDPVVEFTREAHDLLTAIKRACEGRRRDGKMFSKGSCVRAESRKVILERLLEEGQMEMMAAAGSFEDIYDTVKINAPWGIGPMMIYNIAERIGAYRNIYPERYVYLHAGPMKGWRRMMGKSERRFRVPVEEIPHQLRSLKPHDVEDFLCEFRDLLHPGLLDTKREAH